MKNLIILTLLACQTFATSIIMNFAKDDNKSFSIIHLKDTIEFSCEKKIQNITKYSFICSFSGQIDQNIQTKENKDFKINFYKNIITIKPKNFATLYPVKDELPNNSEILTTNKSKYKHWIIVGYKKPLKIFEKNEDSKINFPISFYESSLPHVGVLDLEEKPIESKIDADKFAKIKAIYKQQKYERVIEGCNLLIENNPNTTFVSELKLYKLRALDKLMWIDDDEREYFDPYESVDLAQEWIEQNPSSESLAEVLMYISKAYFKLGLNSKAKKYIDLLMSEYKENEFSHLTQIHYADQMFSNGNKASAIKLYKDVLYETKKIDIAATVALKLSNSYLAINDVKNAVKFYKMILKADDDFLHDNASEIYHVAKKLADAKKYKLAIKSVETLLKKANKKDKTAQEMEKNLAYWYELKGNIKLAYMLYEKYLIDYEQGYHVEFVKERIDKLKINFDEKNETKRLNYLNNLIKNYPNDPVSDKAILQKAKILLSNKKLDEVLNLKKDLFKSKEGNETIKKAAIQKIFKLLKNDDCLSAVSIITEYNIKPKNNQKKEYYNCFMRVAEYKKAFDVSKKFFNDKNLTLRLDWTYKGAKATNHVGMYKNTILLSSDIEKLAKSLNTNKYTDIMYEKTEAYYNLKKYDDLMLKEAQKIEKVFKGSIKNIDIYDKILRYSKNKNDNKLIEKYSKKIINLQKIHKISDYSPMVEFDLINALKKLNKNKEALQIGLDLLYKKLNDNQRARALYSLGEISLKIDKTKEAKDFFLKCGEIVKDSKWQKLCVENMKLLK